MSNHKQQTKTYAGGRTCSHDGCETVLSKYNSTEVCAVHKRDLEDPPDRMVYEGHYFAHCPVCELIVGLRKKETFGEMCGSCAQKVKATAQDRTCPKCGITHPKTSSVWPAASTKSRLCWTCYWNRLKAYKTKGAK